MVWTSRQRRAGWRRSWFARGLFLGVLVVVLVVFSVASPETLDTGDKLASIGALIFAAAALVLSVGPVRAVVVNTDTVAAVAADLAVLVERQWAQEAALRLLRRTRPLAVRWSAAGGSPGPVVAGEVTALADAYRAHPGGRMVIVGPSGSGKTATAVLVLLDLLASRSGPDPVPVLLSMASWNPADDIGQWIVGRIGQLYPSLSDRHRYGDDAVERLVRAGRVLPILDGLDELAPGQRPVVVDALNVALAGRPLILTSRVDAYIGHAVDAAFVVDLQSLDTEAVATYLTEGPDAGARWASVVAAARSDPDGPVARALSTPLNAYLARVVFADATTKPIELLDGVRYPEPELIEQRLLDGYLPAVFGETAGRARGWLAFLGTRLAGPEGDLAWWQLPQALPDWSRVGPIIAATVGGLAAGAGVGISVGLVAGWSWGLGAALVAILWSMLWFARGYAVPIRDNAEWPHRVRLQLRRLFLPTRKGVIRGLQCMVLVGVQAGTFLGVGLGFQYGLSTGIRDGLLTALLVGVPAGLAEFMAQNVTGPGTDGEWSSPRSSLANDRAATLVHAATGAVVIGPPLSLGTWLLSDVRTAAVVGFVSVVSGVVGSAVQAGVRAERLTGSGMYWVPYTMARLVLAARCRIPLALQRFLEDAHSRGVLRQEGPVYQFRHARVRDHLVSTAHSSGATGPQRQRLPHPTKL